MSKYVYCLIHSNKTPQQITDFLRKYLTEFIGLIKYVYTNNLFIKSKLMYIAISSVDLQGLQDHYGFNIYSQEYDFQIEPVLYDKFIPLNCPLHINLPDYKSDIYKKQLVNKLNKLSELGFISNNDYFIRYSDNSCVLTFNNTTSLETKFIIKIILNHTYFYDTPNKIYHISKVDWIIPDLYIKYPENFKSIIKYNNDTIKRDPKNYKLIKIPANN